MTFWQTYECVILWFYFFWQIFQGYKIIGSHSGVKLCRWTKSQLRGRGGCYKHSFYGIESHRYVSIISFLLTGSTARSLNHLFYSLCLMGFTMCVLLLSFNGGSCYSYLLRSIFTFQYDVLIFIWFSSLSNFTKNVKI